MANFLPLVILIAATCKTYAVHSLSLEARPGTFIAGVTPNLTLKCSPGDTIDVVSNIVVFQLSKGGILLATGKPGGVTLSDSLRTSKYSGTDQIDLNNLPNAFLLFTIQFPEAEDEGEYMCHMNYEDKDGFFQNAECTFNLIQNNTDDIGVQNQLKQTLQLVENMRTRVNTLETQVFDLVNVNINQSHNIADLTAMASNHIAFFASLENQCIVNKDDVVVFDHVMFNNGSAFNSTSGVFLAPKSGFYSLSLVCEVQSDKANRMEMMMTVNGSTIMKLFISNEVASQGSQQSGSLVYHLAAGSEVKVVVGRIQNGASNPVALLSENLSYFSGYFLG